MKRLKKFLNDSGTILLSAHRDTWMAIACDKKAGIVVDTSIKVTGSRTDRIVVSHADLMRAIATKPDAIRLEGDTAIIGAIHIATKPVKNFLDIPERPGVAGTPIPLNLLRLAATACGDLEGNIAHACVRILPDEIHATDALRAIIVPCDTGINALIMNRAIAALDKRVAHIAVWTTPERVFLSDGSTLVWHRTVDAKFPDIRRVLNKDARPIAIVDTTSMLAAIEVCKPIADTQNNMIYLDTDGATMACYASDRSSRIGAVVATTGAVTAKHRQAFNYRFIRDVCATAESMTYHASTPTYPAEWRDTDTGIIWIVMPITGVGPDRPGALSPVVAKPEPKPTRKRPALVEIIPGHVWSSPAMADEVRQALEAWGCME